MAKEPGIQTEYLLHLIVCALSGEEPRKEEGVDYCALFEIAKNQEIFCLINDLIQSSSFIDEDAKRLFKNHTLSEMSRMIALKAERGNLFSKLTENKIRFMPLKGLIFKDYYPKESMRQMSDNDILIDETKRETAAQIMNSLGYRAFDTTQNSDDFFKKPYYTFELHRSLFDSESEFSPKFGSIWQNAVQDKENEYLYHMKKEDVYIYSVCHMYKHYIKNCCGIRFLIDNYLFLKKEADNLDWNYINSELEKNSLSDFGKQTCELALKTFEHGKLTDNEKALLNNFLNFGIFGNSEGKILQTYYSVSNGKSDRNAKFKYILRRLFPKKSEMLFNYPILEKKPYLLPFMLIHRFFKGIIHIKESSDELKKVNQIQQEK